MPYANSISRSDINEVPAELSTQIVQQATEQSVAMQRFRRANVSKRQNRFPVLSALPTAYWVNGDTGLKQTTQMAWANKVLNVEELAAIVPVPENVLDDADFDIWGEVRPRIEEAIARAVELAVWFGINAPSAFPTNVRAAAIAAGNQQMTGATQAQGSIFGDLDNLLGLLDGDGYDPSGYAMDRKMRARFRKARNTVGDRQDGGRVANNFADFDGDVIDFFPSGVAPVATAAPANGVLAFGVDYSQFIFGVRSDMQMKVLDQAVITDDSGQIIYNLPQQDMVALRITFRCGWEVANPINYANPTAGTRYPAAVLEYTTTT